MTDKPISDDWTGKLNSNQILNFDELLLFWISVMCVIGSVIIFLLFPDLPFKELFILAAVIFFIVMVWKSFWK